MHFFLFFSLLLASAGLFAADTFHVVKRGETLYSLARGYGVSLETLLERNKISDPADISIGTRLIIPASISKKDSESKLYEVQKGDTYFRIAGKYNMSVEELLSLNGRYINQVLSIGEKLVIKSVENVIAVSKKPSVGSGKPFWPVEGEKKLLNGKLIGVKIVSDALSFVEAVASGHVVWTGPYRGFGQVVLVDSSSYIYLYGGNEDIFVNPGEKIVAGNKIGRLGPAGPGGAKQEMIFSVFKGGVPVDPIDAPRG